MMSECIILVSNSEGERLELERINDGRFVLRLIVDNALTAMNLSISDMRELKCNIAPITL